MSIIIGVLRLDVERIELGAAVGSLRDFGSMLANYFPSRQIFTADYILTALPFALQLTLLAYLDSLLTALVVDRMTREKSKLNKELMAQGLANAASGFMQGIPGAQATIRSVLLIKEGAQTRLSGILIGVFALVSIILLKDFLTLVPAAVFVGVLLKAGFDVTDKDFVIYYVTRKWATSRKRNIQLAFILYTTLVTVLVDLNMAVISGTILFYLAKYFWKIEDAEATLQDISEKEASMVTK